MKVGLQMNPNSYYRTRGLRLKIYFDRGWVIANEYYNKYSDQNIADWIGISLEDYRETLKYFNGKQIRKDLETSHFSFKSEAEKAIEWINSIRIANKLKD